jgi:hypothetical protein
MMKSPAKHRPVEVIPGVWYECGDYVAERFYKSDGASFTGWIVRTKIGSRNYSDPISNKRDALRLLTEWANV